VERSMDASDIVVPLSCLFGFFLRDCEERKGGAGASCNPAPHTKTENHYYLLIANMTNNRNAWGSHNVDAIALVTTLLLLVVVGFASASSSHAVSRWKAPNSSTPPPLDQTRRWREEDEGLHAYIASSVPAVLQHTGSEAFDEHLQGVQAILRYWGSPRHLSNAGLFHSICELK
jgi:hypothetical protein